MSNHTEIEGIAEYRLWLAIRYPIRLMTEQTVLHSPRWTAEVTFTPEALRQVAATAPSLFRITTCDDDIRVTFPERPADVPTDSPADWQIDLCCEEYIDEIEHPFAEWTMREFRLLVVGDLWQLLDPDYDPSPYNNRIGRIWGSPVFVYEAPSEG